MQILTNTYTQQADGLDQLIRVVLKGSHLTSPVVWIERAMEQLEMDDTIEARAADEMADLLEHAEELALDGKPTHDVLNQVAYLYQRARGYRSLSETWIEKGESLTPAQLKTELWSDFQAALECASDGDLESAQDWVDETEQNFLQVWAQYDALQVMPEEITSESVLGHYFLREGVEAWLEALAGLKELGSGSSYENVLAEAKKDKDS